MRRCPCGCSPSKCRRITQVRKCGSVENLGLLLLSTLCALLAACGGVSNVPSIEGSVTGTSNPLVAQYTVATGCQGQAMVEFGPDTSYGRSTSWYPLAGQYKKTTILVAGMRAGTTYHMRAQAQCFGNTLTTSDTTFTTGALPSTATFPALQITRPDPPQPDSEGPGIELIDTIAPTSN